jgi:DNA-directed RNA polymerase subunit alpha
MLIQNGDKLINTRNWSELVKPEQLARDPKSTEMYGKFVCEPLERGFATTIGNSLRRVLLSSLQGAAIVAARIEGVQHEFTTVKGVLEDVTEIVLNLKQVRLAMTSVEPQKLVLEAKKKGPVTAGNIKENQNIRVLNPEQHIATLSEDREFRMEIEVRMGKGYVPSEMHDGLEDEIGLIALDASFSPVRKVAYMVEQARVGQMTNYDKLIIEVWTDGTMRPQEALSQSARILVQHFSLVAGVTEEVRMEEIAQTSSAIPQEIYETPIEQLDLSVRVFNSLKRTGITNVGEVLEMLGRGDEAMLTIRNFGAKSLTELREKLLSKGLLKPGDLPESNLPEEDEEEEGEE